MNLLLVLARGHSIAHIIENQFALPGILRVSLGVRILQQSRGLLYPAVQTDVEGVEAQTHLCQQLSVLLRDVPAIDAVEGGEQIVIVI